MYAYACYTLDLNIYVHVCVVDTEAVMIGEGKPLVGSDSAGSNFLMNL